MQTFLCSSLQQVGVLFVWLWLKNMCFRVGCSSDGRTGHPLIRRLMVWSLSASVCVPNYPWTRYWTLSCSLMHSLGYECVWILNWKHLGIGKKCLCDWLNKACCITCLEFSSGIEKSFIRNSPFTSSAEWNSSILLVCYLVLINHYLYSYAAHLQLWMQLAKQTNACW